MKVFVNSARAVSTASVEQAIPVFRATPPCPLLRLVHLLPSGGAPILGLPETPSLRVRLAPGDESTNGPKSPSFGEKIDPERPPEGPRASSGALRVPVHQ
ncbi:hypothetical protein THAOC_18599 [Thalassiosira oceanica]|uniref:Uncharacterized protein n=1 Tax=Thalassiosira oceanica TaxID=159749 RepID=K0SIX6_THAOC|nr:hypothetical protein THAOC_18599 [Thalassiosira oceanica]|eukprot:EJK60976.1 hypothetical protein THAOC_18599 [Thalassiosira oceanica]